MIMGLSSKSFADPVNEKHFKGVALGAGIGASIPSFQEKTRYVRSGLQRGGASTSTTKINPLGIVDLGFRHQTENGWVFGLKGKAQFVMHLSILLVLGYDSDFLLEFVTGKGASSEIPPRSNRIIQRK